MMSACTDTLGQLHSSYILTVDPLDDGRRASSVPPSAGPSHTAPSTSDTAPFTPYTSTSVYPASQSLPHPSHTVLATSTVPTSRLSPIYPATPFTPTSIYHASTSAHLPGQSMLGDISQDASMDELLALYSDMPYPPTQISSTITAPTPTICPPLVPVQTPPTTSAAPPLPDDIHLGEALTQVDVLRDGGRGVARGRGRGRGRGGRRGKGHARGRGRGDGVVDPAVALPPALDTSAHGEDAGPSQVTQIHEAEPDGGDEGDRAERGQGEGDDEGLGDGEGDGQGQDDDEGQGEERGRPRRRIVPPPCGT